MEKEFNKQWTIDNKQLAIENFSNIRILVGLNRRMKFIFSLLFITISFLAIGQKEMDTIYKRCPMYITDTAGYNNYFLEFQPATIHVDKVKGDLQIVIEQKEQFFSLFFGKKHLENKEYKIKPNAKSNHEVAAKYSFRSGDQVSYVTVTSGTVSTSFDEETKLWNIKINGILSNYVGRNISYFKVRANFFIKG